MKNGLGYVVCSLVLSLASFHAHALKYEVLSSGLAGDSYISQNDLASGLFDVSGVLPSDARIKNASVRFVFRDDTDQSITRTTHHETIRTAFVFQESVIEGTTIREINVRQRYETTRGIFSFDREAVDVSLGGGLFVGTATPVRVTLSERTEVPVDGLVLDHQGSSSYVVGYPCEDHQCAPIFGTRLHQYYDQVINAVDTTTYDNEPDFSLFSYITDSSFLESLTNDQEVGFSLRVHGEEKGRGDALFSAAYLVIETYDANQIPEPNTGLLLGVGLLWFTRRWTGLFRNLLQNLRGGYFT